MSEHPDPRKDKASKASGLAAWLRKRAEAKRTRDLAIKAARQAAVASVGRVVATAVAAGAIGGAGGVVAADRAGLVDLSGPVEANVAAIETIEDELDLLEADTEQYVAMIADLEGRVAGLASLLSATDAVNNQQIEQVIDRIESVAADTEAASSRVAARVASLGAALSAVQVDLPNVVANQESIGDSLDGVAVRLEAVALDLAGTKTLAEDALDEALAAQDLADAAQADADRAGDLASEALADVVALANTVAALADQVDALASDVASNAAALDEVVTRLDDLEDRVAAEEAEPAVVENDYDDSGIREVIAAAFVILPSVSGDGAENPTMESEPVTFVTSEDDGPANSSGRIDYLYRFTFTPNFSNCQSVTIYIDGNFTRNISANNSAGRSISYAAGTSLFPGEHTIHYEVDMGPSFCLIIEPTYELRAK